MGGNVFKDGSTRRYLADEYFDVIKRVTPLVAQFSNRFAVIPAYKTKESFGDMDILFVRDKPIDYKYLDQLFNAHNRVERNSGVWSLVFESIQIDLISTPAEEFDYALNYFSYNDRGNLIGKIAHKFGLKLGHAGLLFPVRSSDHILGEIVLTRNPIIAESFLDIVSGKEFDTLEDIFHNVSASTFFNPHIYDFSQMNAVARVRDKKRSTYNAFLKYCAILIDQHPASPWFVYNEDKSVYHEMIFNAFPQSRAEFLELWKQKEIREDVARKFNGDIVSDITNYKNKELGNFMAKFKKMYSTDMLYNMSSDEVVIAIKNFK